MTWEALQVSPAMKFFNPKKLLLPFVGGAVWPDLAYPHHSRSIQPFKPIFGNSRTSYGKFIKNWIDRDYMQTGVINQIGRGGPGILTNIWHLFGLGFWYVLIRVLNRVSILGKENIPQRGEKGVLLLYNHVSAIDPFTVGATSMPFFSRVWWRAPAKEELFHYPVIRNILFSWGAFPVRRGKQDFESIQFMAQCLRDSVIVIAPEGKRSKDGNLLPGRPGVGRIIFLGNPRKVIPVAIQGTDRVLPSGKIVPRIFQNIKVCYGTPISFGSLLEGADTKEISQEIVDKVMGHIADLKLRITS